jgi:hypothetical protein
MTTNEKHDAVFDLRDLIQYTTYTALYFTTSLYPTNYTMAEPLTRGQKMFNQRLLAEHCVSESRAREIWSEIAASNENEGMGADNYEDSLAVSNVQLKHCGLEIVAVSIKKEGEKKPQSHYAMVNMYPDEVAKKSFTSSFHGHQYAFVRLVLQKLVEGPSARSTLLNLRNELDENHKLGLDDTEKAFEKLLDAKWIEGTDAESRRGSMSSKVNLAPRAYMELSYLLVDQLGMSADDLPQQIYHRH